MHCLNGPFNTIWRKTIASFAKLIDNPSNEQKDEFIVLQNRTKQFVTDLKQLRGELKAGDKRKQDLQAGVSKARAKLQNAQRGTVGAIRREIALALTSLNEQEKMQVDVQKNLKQSQRPLTKDCVR